MEIQEWDEPQCFDVEKNNDNINNDTIKQNMSHNTFQNNSNHNHANYMHNSNDSYTNKNQKINNSYFPQEQYNNRNVKYYNYNHKKGNTYYIKKEVNDTYYNHSTTAATTTTTHYPHSSKLNQQNNAIYSQYCNHNNKNHMDNTYYSKQSVTNNNYNYYNYYTHNNQTHSDPYIHYPSYRTNEQKETIDFKSYDTLEINKSNGTILYCPPYAKKERDIITIPPYQSIPSKPQNCIRIIALGCTHEMHNNVFYPNGDLLIHAGDICNWRRYHHTKPIYETAYDTWKDFVYLLNKIRNKTKENFKYGMYITTGNHDKFAEQNTNKIQKLLSENNIHLLINKYKTINVNNNKTLSIFGSPISWYRNKPSNAFQIHRNKFKYLWKKDDRPECNKHWDYTYIKNNFQPSNILVSHGTCVGFGDCEEYGKGIGSYELLKFIKNTKPKLFICSDFHGTGQGTHGYGIGFLQFSNNPNDFCICMNVAIAHTKARYMRAENIRRAPVIVDMNMKHLF